MAALILPSRFRQQPKYPVAVDWNHPLAAGLEEFTLVTPWGMISALGSNSQSMGSTPTLQATGVSGYGRRSNQLSSTQYEQLQLKRTISLSAITVYSRVISGTTVSDPGTGTSTARWAYSAYLSAGNASGITVAGQWQIGAVNTLGANRINTSITVTPGKEYDCFVTHPGGTAGFTLDVLGVGSNTTSTTAISYTPESAFIQHGVALSTSSPGDKTIFVGGLWRRALSDNEKQEIANNPWQIFKPKKEIFYFSTGSVTIPTLSNPGVTNILTTSATPQVTLTF